MKLTLKQNGRNIRKRILSAFLSILLALTLIPWTPSPVLAEGGRFALLALNADGILIAPTYVAYEEEDTIADALVKSGYSFGGLETGYLDVVQGVTDNFVRYYDDSAYALDALAAETGITAMWITTNADQGYQPELLALVKVLAANAASDDGRMNYEAVRTAYQGALDGFYGADAETASGLAASLDEANESYQNWLNRDVYEIRLEIHQGDGTIAPAVCEFTDEAGAKTVFGQGEIVELGAGTYRFDISDGANNHVRGSYTVADTEEEQTLAAELPSYPWLADLELGYENLWTEGAQRDKVSDFEYYFLVPDYAGTAVYPYLTPAESIDTTKIGIYAAEAETVKTSKRSWRSNATALSKTIEKDSVLGASRPLEARQLTTEDPYGYEQYQPYQVLIERIPTLSGIAVSGDGTKLPLAFDKKTLEYEVTTVSDSLVITADSLCPEPLVTINHEDCTSGQPAEVMLEDCDQEEGLYLIPITVTHSNGQSTTYVIRVRHEDSVAVTFSKDADVSVQVFSSEGQEMAPASVTDAAVSYQLIPDGQYSWISTKQEWYHTKASFTAEQGMMIEVPTPIVENWIKTLGAKNSTSKTAVPYDFSPELDPAVHTYHFAVGSTMSGFYLHSNAIDSTNYTVTACYNNYYNNPQEKALSTSATGYTTLASFLNASGIGNTIRLQIAKKAVSNGVIFYEDYTLYVDRMMQLNGLGVAGTEGESFVLGQKESDLNGFDKTVLEYETYVPGAQQEMKVSFVLPYAKALPDTSQKVTVICGDFSEEASYDDENLPNVERTVSVPLDTLLAEETIILRVTDSMEGSIAQDYTIHVNKLPPIMTSITTIPSDAVIFLKDSLTGTALYPNEEGMYELNDTGSYDYTITRNGYVGLQGSFVASEENSSLTFELEAAAEQTFTDLSGEQDWASFRGNDENNGVTNVATPVTAEDTVLVWANKIGEGYSSGATGCPILVGDYLYTYAGSAIVKVDKNTGEVVKAGQMYCSSSFAINSPTYADGMIFVGLSGGRVQAFNAETLESLWLYTDVLGGQPNCQITYEDGYVYTGFWNSETKKANMVCLSVTDENPDETMEPKLPTWTLTDNGFYWAGAYASENFVLITTDDGDTGYTSGHGSVLSLHPKTGRVLDRQVVPGVGDLRSSICYDAETNAYYFTSKGGDFYQIRVNADGTFVEDSLRVLHLDNGSDNVTNPPMSTSTPVIYKNRAYIGVSGTAQFGAYSGHNITVIDLNSFSIAYSVPTQGYPQTSGLLTTAYEGSTEYVYVYFIDNYTPGKIRVIRDRAGQTELDHTYSTMETFTNAGVTTTLETAYVLFTPSGSQAQYAICSPIVDAEGNIYFKNDSAQLMKLSSTISSLEVTEQPLQTEYCAGQVFDPTGIRVTAHYTNQSTKDITAYISLEAEGEEADREAGLAAEDGYKLKESDTRVTVSYDLNRYLNSTDSKFVLYQDKDGTPGTNWYMPTATVDIQVYSEHSDADQDGLCDRCGEQLEVSREFAIVQEPEDASVMDGLNAIFHVAVNREDVTYQWYYYNTSTKKWSKTTMSGFNTDTLTVKASMSRNHYLYRCQVTDSEGTVLQTRDAELTVQEAPTVTISQDVSCEVGQNAVFSVTTTGEAIAYQWYYYNTSTKKWSKTTLSGYAADTLTVKATEARNGYMYRCNVTFADGSEVVSAAALLTVMAAHTVRISGDVQTQAGKNAVFSVQTSAGAVSYQWYYYNTSTSKWSKTTLTGCTTDTLTVQATAARNGYKYRCTVTFDDETSKTSDEAVLTIREEAVIGTSGDATVEAGQIAVFTVECADAVAYQWYYYNTTTQKWSKTTMSGCTTDTLSVNAMASRNGYKYRCLMTFADGSTKYSPEQTLHVTT